MRKVYRTALGIIENQTIPWMMDNPEQVNLDNYVSGCGTHKCVMGWFVAQNPIVANEILKDASPTVIRQINREYGPRLKLNRIAGEVDVLIEEAVGQPTEPIFGSSDYGDLEERLEALRNLREDLEC